MTFLITISPGYFRGFIWNPSRLLIEVYADDLQTCTTVQQARVCTHIRVQKNAFLCRKK